jgi:hypothetical protein
LSCNIRQEFFDYSTNHGGNIPKHNLCVLVNGFSFSAIYIF